MSVQPFADFLKAHHKDTAEVLRERLGKNAFLLVRAPKAAPLIVTLDPAQGAVLGSEPDTTLPAPGLAAAHCKITYHPGFAGWVLNAPEPTSVNATEVPRDRPLLLSARDLIRFPTSPLRVEFYDAKTLISRLRKVGATKRIKRIVVAPPKPGTPADSAPFKRSEAAATPPSAAPSSAAKRPRGNLMRTGTNRVSWSSDSE